MLSRKNEFENEILASTEFFRIKPTFRKTALETFYFKVNCNLRSMKCSEELFAGGLPASHATVA